MMEEKMGLSYGQILQQLDEEFLDAELGDMDLLDTYSELSEEEYEEYHELSRKISVR